MKEDFLENLFGCISGLCFFLGCGGAAGCVEFGTGLIATIVLFVVSGITGYLCYRELGKNGF